MVLFSDNMGVVGALFKCSSSNHFGDHIIQHTCKLEESLQCYVWYERVNTASNISDAPSRFDFDTLNLGVRQFPCLAQFWELLGMESLTRGKSDHAKSFEDLGRAMLKLPGGSMCRCCK